MAQGQLLNSLRTILKKQNFYIFRNTNTLFKNKNKYISTRSEKRYNKNETEGSSDKNSLEILTSDKVQYTISTPQLALPPT